MPGSIHHVCVCGGWWRGADAKMIIPAITVIEREARRSQRTERVPVLSGPGDDLTRGGGVTGAIQRTRRRNFPAGPSLSHHGSGPCIRPHPPGLPLHPGTSRSPARPHDSCGPPSQPPGWSLPPPLWPHSTRGQGRSCDVQDVCVAGKAPRPLQGSSQSRGGNQWVSRHSLESPECSVERRQLAARALGALGGDSS